MNASFKDNYLLVKFNDYYQLIYNYNLMKDFFSISVNANKKKLLIDFNNCIIISTIDDQILLYNVFKSFQLLCEKKMIYAENCNIDNILVIHNNINKQYFIFGPKLSKVQGNIFDIINKVPGKSVIKDILDLSYLVFTPDVNFQSIDNYLYNKNISFVIGKTKDTKSYPIKTMTKKYSKYLTNVINFIKTNKDEIANADYIIISKNNIDLSIIDNEIIKSLKNYLIIGNKTEKTLMSSNISSTIKTLYEKNLTGIRDIDITKIYSSYDTIILRSKFLVEIIDNIEDYDIEELSIILSYYDKI